MAYRGRPWVGWCLVVAGCTAPGFEDVRLQRGQTWTAASVCIPDPAKVDVLLVVDDSPSMAEEALQLGQALRSFGEIYDDGAGSLDYRLGVLSTHVSRPGCEAGPDGALQARSCREHVADFEVTTSHESDPQDVSAACEAVCSLPSFDTLPTLVDGSEISKPRPWIQRQAGVHNLPEGVGVAEALACTGSLGVAGCERESPMAAVSAALRRFSDPADPGYGFLRDEAGLAIVFLGDEDDCSLPPDAPELDGAGTPSAQCWNAAVVCDGEGCEVRDGPLSDVDALGAVLRSVETRKQRMTGRNEQRVFASAVAGVPNGWPWSEQVFEADGSAFAEAFGVGAGCEDQGRRATPVVRLRDLVGAFSAWDSDLVSSCSGAWEAVLSCLPGAWPAREEPLCLAIPDSIVGRGDFEPELQCVVTETREGQDTVLPACSRSCEPHDCDVPVWSVPDGEASCVAWANAVPSVWGTDDRDHDVDNRCIEAGTFAQARVLRKAPARSGSCTRVTCGDTP